MDNAAAAGGSGSSAPSQKDLPLLPPTADAPLRGNLSQLPAAARKDELTLSIVDGIFCQGQDREDFRKAYHETFSQYMNILMKQGWAKDLGDTPESCVLFEETSQGAKPFIYLKLGVAYTRRELTQLGSKLVNALKTIDVPGKTALEVRFRIPLSLDECVWGNYVWLWEVGWSS
jgi:hypothetical protein